VAVTIRLEYDGDLHCAAVHEPSGSRLVTDAPVDNGGKGESFSPTDLAATALGACVVTIMGLLARRHGWDLAGTRVRVVKEMTASPTRRIGALTVTVEVPHGRVVDPSDRILLERCAETCPVRQSLHPDVKVSIAFEYGD
jgi:putative redox protein